jgi:hypothetical protein
MRDFVWMGLIGAALLAIAGCGETVTGSGIAQTHRPGDLATPPARSADQNTDVSQAGVAQPAASPDPSTDSSGAGSAAQLDPARPRTFAVEGPGGAIRLTFDDLDLLKIINMDDVSPDCVSRMPQWMRDLNGRKVRIRGFMKPSDVQTGLPQFLFVRSTDLCCFGPKGKVYHWAAVMLKEGTTTDYIELKPFDVVGTFRIEPIQLDDDTVFLLYHIDDAAILQK